MFIIRVELAHPTRPRPYEMYEAKTYSVARGPKGVRLSIVFKDDTVKEIEIVDGMEAFAMNEQGKTIDTVRPRTKEVQDRMLKLGV